MNWVLKREEYVKVGQRGVNVAGLTGTHGWKDLKMRQDETCQEHIVRAEALRPRLASVVEMLVWPRTTSVSFVAFPSLSLLQ